MFTIHAKLAVDRGNQQHYQLSTKAIDQAIDNIAS